MLQDGEIASGRSGKFASQWVYAVDESLGLWEGISVQS